MNDYKVLSQHEMEQVPEVVDGNFYSYSLSLSERNRGWLGLKLINKDYLVDIAMVMGQLVANKGSESNIRWENNLGLGFVRIPDRAQDENVTFVNMYVPNGVMVLAQHMKRPHDHSYIDRTWAMSHLENWYAHYLTPAEVCSRTVHFKMSYNGGNKATEMIKMNKGVGITSINIEDGMRFGDSQGSIEILGGPFRDTDADFNRNKPYVGQRIMVPIEFIITPDTSRTRMFNCKDPFDNHHISKAVSDTYSQTTREHLAEHVGIDPNELKENVALGKVFFKPEEPKDNSIKISTEEAAEQIKKFGESLVIVNQAEKLARSITAKRYLGMTEGNTPALECRLIKHMTKCGVDTGIRFLHRLLNDEIKYQRQEEVRKTKNNNVADTIMDTQTMKEYLKTQPYSRKQVRSSVYFKLHYSRMVPSDVLELYKKRLDKYNDEHVVDNIMKNPITVDYIDCTGAERESVKKLIITMLKDGAKREQIILGMRNAKQKYIDKRIAEINESYAQGFTGMNDILDTFFRGQRGLRRTEQETNVATDECGEGVVVDQTGSVRTESDDKETAIRPRHYGKEGIQPLDFIRAHGLGFNLGNVVKYVARAGKKDPEKHIEDLEKAAFYLNEEINILKYPHLHEQRMREHAALEEEYRRKLEDE